MVEVCGRRIRNSGEAVADEAVYWLSCAHQAISSLESHSWNWLDSRNGQRWVVAVAEVSIIEDALMLE